MLADLPARGWLTIVLTWLRVLCLAGAYVLFGRILDALLAGAGPGPGTLLATGVLLAAAAGAAGLAAAEPPRLQAQQELVWRGRLIRSVLDGEPHQLPTGTVVSRLTDGVERVAGYRANFLPPTIGSFTTPALVLVVLALAVDVGLAARLAVLAALVPVVVAFFMRLFRRPNARYRRLAAAVAGRFHELLRSLGTLRLLGATGRGRTEVVAASARLESEIGAMLRRSQLMILVNDALFSLVMVTAALVLALHGLAAGALTPGAVLTTFGLALLLHEPIDKVGRSFYIGMGGRAEQRELQRLVQAPARPARRRDWPRPGVGTMVTGLGVDRDGQPVLRDVSVAIPAGGLLAVVGSTGAGKSTLALTLQGLLEPVAGQVSIGGVAQDAAGLRAQVCSVPQQPYLFTGTIAENLHLARPQATAADLWQALSRAHLADEVAGMADRLDTQVGEGGMALSGGQVRRLGLARALLTEASVLVLDEPTADLDRRSEQLVTRTLTELHGRRTLIVIAHRLETTVGADLVLVLRDGRVVELAPPTDLLEGGGYYAAATATEALGVRG